MPHQVRVITPGNGPPADAAARVEILCDTCTSAEEIVAAAGAMSRDAVVLLRLTAGATDAACRASLAAHKTLGGSARRVRIAIDLHESVDGTAAHLDPPNPVHDVLGLTERLRGAGPDLLWSVALTQVSVWKLDGIFSLARDKGVRLIPVPGAQPLSPDAQLFTWDFTRYCLLGEFRSDHGPAMRAYIEALRQELEEARLGTRTEPGGTTFPAGALLTGALAGTLADTAGTGPGASDVGLADVLQLAGQGLRAHAGAALAPATPKALPRSFDSAVLVGAYGGEHIGDLAILGGVLRRMHAQFGLKEAVLMTQRPLHTRHLMPMLDTPVALSVAEYEFPEIARHLARRDALIHAGGPLTDIPKQLVRHLFAAGLAKRAGKPFLMEGIGPNVFKRKASHVTARRLVRLADRITLRTSDDATRPIIAGLNVGIGRDPAFDYLETRGPDLTRLMPTETAQIDDLLDGAAGDVRSGAQTGPQTGPLIGINIRPIGDLFTPEAPGRDRVTYTREVEDRMERQLAAGLAQFAAGCQSPPRFVFFPMNAIQFGMSDSRSAYRIVRHLPAGIDARVWQADASLDAVVALIRRLDTVVSMRFHATIFALSQGCLPIGIDYRIGRKDKVAAVMEDAGEAEFCCRIDEVESGWITERLRARLAGWQDRRTDVKTDGKA